MPDVTDAQTFIAGEDSEDDSVVGEPVLAAPKRVRAVPRLRDDIAGSLYN